MIGNHDRWEGADKVTALLEKAGIPVLENASTLLHTPHGTLSGVPRGADALCFTHSPDSFPKLRTCVLTIAGHTHGGQVNLSLVGQMIVPSRYGQSYAAGPVREDGKLLLVSTGIGTSNLAVRLACRRKSCWLRFTKTRIAAPG